MRSQCNKTDYTCKDGGGGRPSLDRLACGLPTQQRERIEAEARTLEQQGGCLPGPSRAGNFSRSDSHEAIAQTPHQRRLGVSKTQGGSLREVSQHPQLPSATPSTVKQLPMSQALCLSRHVFEQYPGWLSNVAFLHPGILHTVPVTAGAAAWCASRCFLEQ